MAEVERESFVVSVLKQGGFLEAEGMLLIIDEGSIRAIIYASRSTATPSGCSMAL